MSQNVDSIEQGASKLSLNPNANEWKPSFTATEFVPSWMQKAAPPAASPAPAAAAAPGNPHYHRNLKHLD
jgi:hypothetical protein